MPRSYRSGQAECDGTGMCGRCVADVRLGARVSCDGRPQCSWLSPVQRPGSDLAGRETMGRRGGSSRRAAAAERRAAPATEAAILPKILGGLVVVALAVTFGSVPGARADPPLDPAKDTRCMRAGSSTEGPPGVFDVEFETFEPTCLGVARGSCRLKRRAAPRVQSTTRRRWRDSRTRRALRISGSRPRPSQIHSKLNGATQSRSNNHARARR